MKAGQFNEIYTALRQAGFSHKTTLAILEFLASEKLI